ncbi:MAG: GspE/PulE family protein [Candidatus Moraniibacteriota bacterium]
MDSPTPDQNISASPKSHVTNELLEILPREAADRYKMIVLEKTGNTLKVGMVDPNNIESQDALRFILSRHNLEAEIYAISELDLQKEIKKYDASKITIGAALKDIEKEQKEEEQKRSADLQVKKVEELFETAPVAKIVDVLIENAIEGEASDIHIEPEEKEVKVRFRVDGVLHSSLFLPKHVGPSIVSRIKILSNLKIDERRKPQDGRFRVKYKGRNVDLRVSTLPVSEGEKVVMRVLDEKRSKIDLTGLGIWGNAKKILEQEIKEPFGLVLITGPTGSGKSTTLYTVLSMLDREERNIITLEDPVEYRIAGINQSQIYPEINFTFATGLRSILRQDPDIIMVGEIRDEETAELTVHAALTGHLVLSTLHTNNAVGAIPRLVDMKVEPFLLSSSLRLVMAQRLVRRVCEHCKKAEKPSPKVESMILKTLKRIPEELKTEARINENNLTVYRGEGCEYCSRTGMKGRVAVFEITKVTDKMKKIIEEDNLKEDVLWEEFYSQGGITMREDGIIKVLQGVTTVSEVERATADTTKEKTLEAVKTEEQIV